MKLNRKKKLLLEYNKEMDNIPKILPDLDQLIDIFNNTYIDQKKYNLDIGYGVNIENKEVYKKHLQEGNINIYWKEIINLIKKNTTTTWETKEYEYIINRLEKKKNDPIDIDINYGKNWLVKLQEKGTLLESNLNHTVKHEILVDEYSKIDLTGNIRFINDKNIKE